MSRMLLQTAIVSVIHAFTAQAAIIYVDRDAPGPASDGTTWCTAFHEVNEALAIASAGDVIRVAEGIYSPDARGLTDPREATFALRAGITLEGAYAGCGAGNPDARDFVGSETILTGDVNGDDGIDCCFPHGGFGCVDEQCETMVCQQDLFCCYDTWDILCSERANDICNACTDTDTSDNAFHILTVDAEVTDDESACAVDGFTFRRGSAVGPPPGKRGGAIYASSGGIHARNCRFEHNFAGDGASGGGGAVYIGGGEGTFTDCSFVGNMAAANDANGGAILNDGGILEVRGTEFTSNSISGLGVGGALSNVAAPFVQFTDCDFADNYSYVSGGAVGNENGTDTLFAGCEFSGNHANASGGAVFNLTECDTIITYSTFTNNTAAAGSGGAVGSYWGCYIDVSFSSFNGNDAFNGGAIETRAGTSVTNGSIKY